MIKSMTGYGRQEAVVDGKKISVEIKSVNHRFSDYNIKVPRYYAFLEDKVRSEVSAQMARGKVDVFINIESYEQADKDIILNEDLARSYIEALKSLRDKFELADDISVMQVAQYTEIFQSQRREEDQESLWKAVQGILLQALEGFSAMRAREGERIETDLRGRIAVMQQLAQKIDQRSPQTVEEYKNRLYDKIKELLEGQDIEETRVLTEVAVFADKVAVNEEVVRLASHFEEFYGILDSGEPAGRKLDFLIQELNREINTIGSKANDIEIAKMVVELKAELEKLREQVQNIE